MSQPSRLSAKFIKKMSSVYLRLSSEVQDEREVTRRFDALIQKGLSLLGIKLSGERLEERTRKIARAAIEHARREQDSQSHIHELELGGKHPYTIHFLPDVRIPRTAEAETRWREFLESLAAKTRIGTDKATGEIGVLYRNGEWLGNLMLSDEFPSLYVLDDITTVAGDLIARGALRVHAEFTHPVTVMGGLHINHDILRQAPPRLDWRGGLTLYGFRSFQDVAVNPERLKAWGVTAGTEVCVRSDRFEFTENPPGKGDPYVLKGLNVLSSYHWRKDSWKRVTQERIDPELFEAVYGRLHRICLILGLGADFIAKSVSRLPDNIDRLSMYLVISLQEAPDKDKESPERSAALRVLDGLAALRQPCSARRVDNAPVEQALKTFSLEDAELAGTLAAMPRSKVSEKDLRADLQTVTTCKDSPLPLDSFFKDGLQVLRTLDMAFHSKGMKQRLQSAFSPLWDAFDAVAAKLDEAHRPDREALLTDPHGTLTLLDKGLAPFGGKFNTTLLRAELNDASKVKIKEACRRISNIPPKPGGERLAKDTQVLRQLYEMKNLECSQMQFSPAQVLALLLPRLDSRGGRLLNEARQVLLGAPPRGHIAQALGQRLAQLPPEQCLAEIRSWMASLLAVVEAYNRLTVSADVQGSETERQAKEFAMISLPPHVAREINIRVKRMTLLWSLGADFLEPLDSAIEDNLTRIRYYLALNLGIVPASPRSTLKGESRALVEETYSHLSTLLHCLDTGDSEEAESALKGFADPVLERLGAIFTKPRHKVQTINLRKDREYLDGLQDTKQTKEKVFVSSGRFLLFANSVLESKQIKQAVTGYIKPIYFALAKLGPSATGVTTNDLLRRTCDPDDFLNRLALSGKDKEAQAIEEALNAICVRSIEDVASDLRKTAPVDAQNGLGRDRELLGRVLALNGNPLGSLQLDSRRSAMLLLMNLESHIADRVKAMFEAGQLSGRPTKRIVSMVRERLEWELAIIRTYNQLTTAVR